MLDKALVEKCWKLTKRNMSKILLVPEVVNKAEDIFWEYQGEYKSPFINIGGELVFWIGSVNIPKDNIDFVLVEVIVQIFTHHPTKLRFRRLFSDKDDALETSLLTFDDCLHMEGKGDLKEIKALMKKRLKEGFLEVTAKE